MRIWVVLGCVLMLLLAACNGDDNAGESNTAVPATSAAVIETESTAEATEAPLPPGNVIAPGVRVDEGVEVVTSNAYVVPDGAGWVLLELRNGNPDPVPNFQVTVSLLDEQNREIGSRTITSPMVNIPAGYQVPLVVEFVVPEGYSDYMALATIDPRITADVAPYVGEYDLPSTVDPLTVDGTFNRVTGTLTNDRGVDLILPVATIGLYQGETLVGVAQAILNGTDERGQWLAGSTINFEATFPYLPTTEITETKVISVGYRIPGQN